MRIAIISPYATVAPHWETELEIAEQHLRRGDEVVFVVCTGELPNCDFNPGHVSGECQACLGRRQDGLRLLCRPVQIRKLVCAPDSVSSREIQLPNRTVDLAELRRLKLDEFDIGQAVVSSLISLCRDPAPALAEHWELLERLWMSSATTFQAVRRFLKSSPFDRIYLFNGRFAAMRAVLRAAQTAGVECLVHERGCDLKHYELYRNHLPHEIGPVEARIRTAWSEGDPAQREAIASMWFQSRRERVESTWHSFTKHQEMGKLPRGFDPHRHNLAVFCSSDDEFAAIGDCWTNLRFPDQAQTLRQLCQSLQPNPEFQVYLRVHPNLANAPRAAEKFENLRLPNLTVIAATDPVDSYALLESSTTIVTFGSTIGIEALYWGRPSILLGPCFYQGLGGTWQPDNPEELLALATRQLPLPDRGPANLYGYWQQTHGIPFEFVEPEGLFAARFKGEIVHARPPKTSGFHKFRRLLTGNRQPDFESV